MSACHVPGLPVISIAALRRRESATKAMISQIDEKLTRLISARDERVIALQKIRCELDRAQGAGQATPDCHGDLD